MPDLDLNLLRTLDALLDTGSVTATAQRMHQSVPAASRALGRLRVQLDDPVLVRAGSRMVATTFARLLAPRVKSLLAEADGLLTTHDDDPATWRRTFSIRMNDALTPVLAPRLLQHVAAEAPGIRLRFVSQESKDPDALREGSIDLDVGIAVPVPPDIRRAALYTDRFVAVTRADSALGRKQRLTARDLAEHPHISASRRGLATGPLDDALARIGLQRDVVAIAPSYAIAALMTLEQNAICLLPRRMTDHLIGQGLALRAHVIPLQLPDVDIEQRWHAYADTEPASRWIRDQLHRTVGA